MEHGTKKGNKETEPGTQEVVFFSSLAVDTFTPNVNRGVGAIILPGFGTQGMVARFLEKIDLEQQPDKTGETEKPEE